MANMDQIRRVVNGRALRALALAVFVGLPLFAPVAHAQVCPFDDGNSSLEVEGLILTRYALGVTAAPLVANTGINAVDAPSVEATINCPSCGLNITGNPTMTVADATIISRKLAGFSGAALTDGLDLGNGTRNTVTTVNSFLLAGCGATGGTVTSITAGNGLTGGTITASGTIAADTTFLQRRVTSTCSAGSFITAVAADGTVTCGTPPAGGSGTVTSVATGTGLTGGTITASGTIAADTTFLQRRVTSTCSAGSFITAVAADGTVTCGTPPAGGAGTVTSVATGAGLTGGPISTSGTVGLASTQLLPTTACATSQIAQWNGSAWICRAPPPTLPTSCLDGQLLKLVGGAIACSAAPQTFTVADSVNNVGQHRSIARSFDGLPIISYYDASTFNLKVMRCGNAACSGGNIIRTVDTTGLGRYTAIAVPSNGLPVISYSTSTVVTETAASALKVAACNDLTCTGTVNLAVVDNLAVAVGRYSSMAISQDGFPVISYYDGTNGNLKVAKCVNSTCFGATITTLDGASGADVGRYTSIAVPADGLPVISYHDVTNIDLKVVKCSVTNCSTFSTPVTVDGTGVGNNVGSRTSIAISADGFPIIAYFDDSASALKVAKCINAGCTGATVINSLTPAAQRDLSIVVPADGRPVIAYAADTGALSVIKCGTASCASGNVISNVAGVTFGAAMLVPASDALPVIAYDNFDLNVVKCSNSGCANP